MFHKEGERQNLPRSTTSWGIYGVLGGLVPPLQWALGWLGCGRWHRGAPQGTVPGWGCRGWGLPPPPHPDCHRGQSQVCAEMSAR